MFVVAAPLDEPTEIYVAPRAVVESIMDSKAGRPLETHGQDALYDLLYAEMEAASEGESDDEGVGATKATGPSIMKCMQAASLAVMGEDGRWADRDGTWVDEVGEALLAKFEVTRVYNIIASDYRRVR